MSAQRIFIDGIGLLRSSVGDHTGHGAFRELLQQLMESFNRENLTAMLSLEVGTAPDSIAAVEMTDFPADTVIHLGRERQGRHVQRSLEVIKSRGQDYEAGEHTLRITSGRGLEVFRRVQAPLRENTKNQPTSGTMRSVIGVDAVDILIGGGVFDGAAIFRIGVRLEAIDEVIGNVSRSVVVASLQRRGYWVAEGVRRMKAVHREHGVEIEMMV